MSADLEKSVAPSESTDAIGARLRFVLVSALVAGGALAVVLLLIAAKRPVATDDIRRIGEATAAPASSAQARTESTMTPEQSAAPAPTVDLPEPPDEFSLPSVGPRCRPPYTVGADGVRHFKPECLGPRKRR